ncbi:MAG: prepilin-type N-terminal cleavage/methylation domain-containing protein [Phycisphaerales bacterium]|nr:prepilin-type N-terminal cleavage/methylation domain-containing protein [Phycisphaerales bacterium]
MKSQRINRSTKRTRRNGFSLIEVLISLTITSTLLTATMAALDASFKSYKITTEGASTNVVARIVMQRVTSMVRTGEEFGPYPVNPISTPSIESTWMEFVSYRDPATGVHRVTRLERRDGEGDDGPFELWYTVTTFTNGDFTSVSEAPLMVGLNKVLFEMEYDVGPTLRRVTIDLIMQPDDVQDAAVGADLETPTIRLVASASPRQFDD